jgi:methylated-DNA-[protein]-cysteine S-methyltransferase
MIPDALERFSTAIGEIEIAALNDMIISCSFSMLHSSENLESNAVTSEAINQLKAYFDGKLKKFELPLDYNGTELQMKVMHLLESIAYGETITYGEIAKKLSVPSGSRAVGNLIGKNPLLILVPCHRVLGTNGKITGYAGGPDRKLWLLQHELTNSKRADRLF